MKFSYVTIRVADLGKSMEFYTKILGFTEKRRIKPKPGIEIVFLSGREGAGIELISGEELNESNGNISLTFLVSNLYESVEDLTEKKVLNIEGPYILENGVKMGHVYDPDNNKLNFIEI